MHIFRSISRNKGNQPLNFDQLIKEGYHVAFFKNNAENQARKLVTDHFSVFLKY